MLFNIFPVALAALLLAASARAAWEDTGAPRRPAPAPVRQPAPADIPPAPRPRRAPPAAARGTPVAPAASYGAVPPDLYSPFLDPQVEPRRWFSILYATAAAVEGSPDDLPVVEVAGRFNLAQWRNVLSGDLDIDLRLRSIIFANDANYPVMPTGLIELPLEAEWTWRFLNGFSWQMGMRPGVYADVEALGDGFGIPFKGALYVAVTPEFSFMVGAEFRPGWNLVAMPLVGMAWEPADFFRLTLAAPQSTALIQVGPVGLFGTLAWRNTTFGMSGEDGDPDQLTLEDLQLGGGLSIAFTDSFRLTAEGGLLVNRTLLAEDDSSDDELDLDDAPYFRLTLGGSF